MALLLATMGLGWEVVGYEGPEGNGGAQGGGFGVGVLVFTGHFGVWLVGVISSCEEVKMTRCDGGRLIISAGA